jgi:predicted metal-dependent hydrolase
MQIGIDNISVIVKRKKIKNIHLAVYPPNGRVTLACPENVNDETLRLFVISKLGWIRRQQRMLQQKDRQSERKYIDRESHYFMGKKYLLKVHEEEEPVRAEIGKGFLHIHVRKGSTIKQREKIINDWYRSQLKIIAEPIFTKWEKKIDVQAEEWNIRSMKTKWGTCNTSSRKILLNLELAKKPVKCIEYIVAHELIHLLERNHNERFISYMDRFMPQWKHYREELNRMPVAHVEWSY